MSNARLVALGRNAANHQWSLVTDIDWRERIVAPWWLPRKTYVAMVSQLYRRHPRWTHALTIAHHGHCVPETRPLATPTASFNSQS